MKKIKVGIILFTLLLSVTSVSFAADVKTYPGSGCQPINSSYPHSLNGWGWLTNLDSAGSRTYSCMIVRDNELASQTAVSGFWVRVNDTSTSKVVSCFLTKVNQDGNFPNWKVRSTSVSGTGQQTLSFGQMFAGLNEILYLECTLPYGSTLISYRIQEG